MNNFCGNQGRGIKEIVCYSVNTFSEGTMSNELSELLAAAKKADLTSDDKEAQRRSFAYGNTKIENDRITRDLVDREAERLIDENNQ